MDRGAAGARRTTSSPWLHQNEGEILVVLTEGFNSRYGGGGMPATVDQNGGDLELGARRLGVCRDEDKCTK
jgi:hypothetical protein